MSLTEVTSATFAQEVLEADRPVLVDFWGPRCLPCLALMPVVEALAEANAGRLKVVKVNANDRPNWNLCTLHNIMGLPTYIFFNGGQEIRRIAGDDATRDALAAAVEEVVGRGD